MTPGQGKRHITWRGQDAMLCGATAAERDIRGEPCDECEIIRALAVCDLDSQQLAQLQLQARVAAQARPARRRLANAS